MTEQSGHNYLQSGDDDAERLRLVEKEGSPPEPGQLSVSTEWKGVVRGGS